MKFIYWVLSTVIIDPLIMLFVWNVIITNMFVCEKTTFAICCIISIIINIIYAGLKSNKDY